VPIVAAVILVISESAAGKVAVFVSIIPQKYFVQKIGKSLVDVQVMVQPGASPATYEPKPKQMAAIAKTYIYFSIGLPFEKAWLNKIASSNPNMMVVQTDQGIQKSPMVDHHHHKSAEVIARGIRGQIIVADPLAPDWAANLRKVSREIRTALR